MYFAGEYGHTLDEKNRIVIPAKFRLFLPPEERRGFFITVDPSSREKCLWLYTRMEWDKLIQKIKTLAVKQPQPNDFMRLFYSHSDFVTFDKQFRLVIPQKLIEFANLAKMKEVIVVGLGDHIQIWNKEEWETKTQALKSQSTNTEQYLGGIQ